MLPYFLGCVLVVPVGLELAMRHTRQRLGAFTEQRGAISADSTAVYITRLCLHRH